MLNTVKDICTRCEELLTIANSQWYENNIVIMEIVKDLKLALDELKVAYEDAGVLTESTLYREKKICNILGCLLESKLEDSECIKRRQDRELVKEYKAMLMDRVKGCNTRDEFDRKVMCDEILQASEVQKFISCVDWVNFEITDEERDLFSKLLNGGKRG